MPLLPFVKADRSPDSPEFPTADVAYAKLIVSKRTPSGRKRRGRLQRKDS